jgi:hypothetical protein
VGRVGVANAGKLNANYPIMVVPIPSQPWIAHA